MKYRSVNELRQMFLNYFEGKDHIILKSAALIPQNDNSLLLINSGMAPLKPYFTGQATLEKPRAASCQKCIRTGDIDNIGKTTRHGTFFEMLGNFSFGDYFKSESLAFTWEFLTKVLEMNPARLYPSVYLEDDEAFAIWEQEIGVDPGRIFRFGKADNFCEHGAGPCGPCSEVYFDRGEKYGCGLPDCNVGCDCDRYVEIWNNVFTQFNGDGQGNYTELEHKNIDTGMGLERLAMVLQGADSLFEIDSVRAVWLRVCELAGMAADGPGSARADTDVSLRIVTDHIRSATFMVSDGIMPANEGRGYVLRRIIRRAARHGRLLGIKGAFLAALAKTVIAGSKEAYPELDEKREFIHNVLNEEEKKFGITIDQGLIILAEMVAEVKKAPAGVLSGAKAFKLYDTYGFPIDLTNEILAEQGLLVDMDGFMALMQEQKTKARKARKDTNYMGADATVYEALDPALSSRFVGYESCTAESAIVAMTTESEITSSLSTGMKGTIITDVTPFYAAAGGQEGDKGQIVSAQEGAARFMVLDTMKLPGEKIGHVGQVTQGVFNVGDGVALTVDADSRLDISKNHSATHLLHKALRAVLGSHVEQAGSLVAKDRLHFDFAHFAAMTGDELRAVEELVNQKIAANLGVDIGEMPLDEARSAGVMALFGEKYGDVVRVVRMGDFSAELCGGIHVDRTGMISAFKILSETGIAAGVRRIEALTGRGLFAYYDNMEHSLKEVALLLKTTPSAVGAKTQMLLSEMKALQAENESLKSKAAKEALGEGAIRRVDIGAATLLAAQLSGVDMNGLRELGDQQKATVESSVVLLISDMGAKVNMMATADETAQSLGIHAGNLLKAIAPLVGGGGGGRPGMAQAGGSDPAGMEAALEKAPEILRAQIKA